MAEAMSSIVPFLGSRGSGGSGMKAAATLGLSLTILRLFAHAIKIAQQEPHDRDVMLSRAEALYQRVRSILKRIILFESGEQGKIEQRGDGSADDEDDAAGAMPILHNGSCHCGCVAFELIAPRKLPYRNSKEGKIHYRHTRCKAKNFRFVQGTKYVQMYYVTIPTKMQQFVCMSNNYTADVVGAHSFCSRCGVHILQAPNSQSTALDVNVDCLDQGIITLKLLPDTDLVDFDAGAAVSGQWDQQEKEFTSHRYPTTIQEEQTPLTMLPTWATRSKSPAYNEESQSSRHHHLHPRLSAWEMENDPNTIDLLFPGGGKAFAEPDTPSTVYTSADSFLSSIPPTLTVDTSRDCINDTDSLASVTSSKSNYRTSSFRGNASDNTSVGQFSFSSAAATSSNIPSMRASQMKYYMARHMRASSKKSLSSKPPASTATSATSTSSERNQGESGSLDQQNATR